MSEKTILAGLNSEHFMHPGDRMTIKKLERFTAFKKILERLLVEGLEDDMYILSLANDVKVGPRQAKNIHDMLLEASSILDMEPPHLFMDTDSDPNAFAFGDKKPIVTLTTGLIDTFADDEIYTVIGHELGHIKCRHSLYSFMAQNVQILMQIISLLPVLGPALGLSFYLYLLFWYRRSELSADRAALLATQSPELVNRTMMKLAGGGSMRIYGTLSQKTFLEQAEEYEKLQKELISSKGYRKWAYIFGTLIKTGLTTHPWPALRTKEAIRFSESDRYKKIIVKEYPVEEEKAEGIFASEDISADIDSSGEESNIFGEITKEKTTKYGRQVAGFFKDKLKKVAEDIEREAKE